MVAVTRNKDKATVVIMSYVGDADFNAASFTALLQDLQDVKEIEIQLHSYGGSVFDGNVIYNAIKAAKAKVHINIIGVAASMASIILAAADSVSIADNGFVMVHRPTTYSGGNAEALLADAKMLQAMEKNFRKVYAAKGVPAEMIDTWMDGQDHWLDADAALAIGIVDKIEQTETPLSWDVSAISLLPIEDVYARYVAVLNKDLNTKNTMDKAKLIEKFGLTGVTADSTDDEVQAALAAKIKEESTETAPAETKPDSDFTTERKQVIEDMVAVAKIAADKKAQFVAIGEKAGIAALAAALEPYKQNGYVSVTAAIAQARGTAGDDNRDNWTWDQWQEKDPKGLAALPEEKTNALYEARYGKKPRN